MILFTALVFAALPIAAVVVVLMGHAPPRVAARPHRPPRQSPRPVAVPDRLAETVRLWLADDRPAWETVDALEHDVQLALEGRSDAAERMAKRPGVIAVDPAGCEHVYVRPGGMAPPVCLNCGDTLPF